VRVAETVRTGIQFACILYVCPYVYLYVYWSPKNGANAMRMQRMIHDNCEVCLKKLNARGV
jgi:hypothetical protein